MASEPFEISSRRKISLLLYSECTIRSRIWTTSAWKVKLSCVSTQGTLPARVHAPGPFGPIIVPNGPGASLTGCRARSLRVSGGAWPPRGTRPRAVTPEATPGSSSTSGRRCSVSRRGRPATATSCGGRTSTWPPGSAWTPTGSPSSGPGSSRPRANSPPRPWRTTARSPAAVSRRGSHRWSPTTTSPRRTGSRGAAGGSTRRLRPCSPGTAAWSPSTWARAWPGP